jgi:divalent metal cation (Fe/Co/Zn/Cd) transporter
MNFMISALITGAAVGVLRDAACKAVASDDTCDSIHSLGMTMVAIITMAGGVVYYLYSQKKTKLSASEAKKLETAIEEKSATDVTDVKI